MCAKKAVIVFRHGDKDDQKNGVLGSNPETFKNLPSNNYYSKTVIKPGTSDKPLAIYYSALTAFGYSEGGSFGVTIPTLVNQQAIAPIKHAFILNPSLDKANGNSYITSYPLLTELVKAGSFTFSFYENATEINGRLNLDDYDGSVLVVGTAEVLAEEGESQGKDDYGNGKDSVLYELNNEYRGNASKPQRGLDIYVYSKENDLEKYIQDPNTKTYRSN